MRYFSTRCPLWARVSQVLSEMPLARDRNTPSVRRRGVSRTLLMSAACIAISACLSSTAPSTTDNNDPCLSLQNIAFGTTVGGSLSATDCQLSNGSYADRWRFSISAQTQVQIDLQSGSFFPFLELRSTSGTTLRTAIDGGPNNSARITMTLSSGSYDVIVNSAGGGSTTGGYLLRVAVAEPDDEG